jgi:hypothetical protein
MKDQVKVLLKQTAKKPNPLRKDAFIRQYRGMMPDHKSDTTFRFLLSQASLISWYVWAISLGVLLLAVVGLRAQSHDITWIVSAFMPFVSMVAVLETFRSKRHAMLELECVTKYSFRGTYFAKLACIGAGHILMILVLILLLGKTSETGYLMTGALITTPYLLTSVLNTRIERTRLGRKSAWVCVGVSALVSILTILAHTQDQALAAVDPLAWSAALLVLILVQGYEIKHALVWEEYSWS